MRKKITILKLVAAFTFALICQSITAQEVQDVQKALSLVNSNAAAIGLTQENLLNSRVSDTYVDALSGNTLVYLQQTYQGFDIDKVIQVLAFKNGKLVSNAGNRIDLHFASMPPVTAKQKKDLAPSVNAEAAIRAAALHLHLPAPAPSSNQKSAAPNQDFSKITDFGDMGIAKENVTTRLVWVPQKTFERVKLAWEVNLSPKKSSDSWRVIVDAKTGDVIKKENYTVPDNWNSIKTQEGTSEKPANINGISFKKANDYKNEAPQGITSATYRVIPFPAEAPSFPKGAPALVSDPWNLSPAGSGATPFIWNDDGSKQYKFTRGNNVLAQEDLNGDNVAGRRAKGVINKNDLFFDFVPDFNQQPFDSINQGFAITNLFYWNNIMHDLSYQYGFDEVSGNFQQNNLGRGGKGYDFVFADAQDGSGFNNANFSTPPDGKNPRMQMYLFAGDPAKHMKINSPNSIAGDVAAVEGDLSPNNLLNNIGSISGNVALYNEDTDTLHIACDPASNNNELNGKIVLLSRGSCGFAVKVLNAQNAGAIAVIVMDNTPGEPPFIMGAAAPDPTITIPAVMISYEEGILIRDVLGAGRTVNVSLFPSPFLDGDLDNGVIAHEYTHGISNRLTGGPSNVSCLSNAEQMGEGWSDYISLMTITDWKKAHTSDGPKPRPIGTYVLNQPPDGSGIRTYPYSTDMKINPHTYGDVAATGGEPHAIGEIWTTVLWDMTWNIIEQDGVINKDIFNANGEGGNTVAYKLVIEGLKLQPCSPGFIDGRDAILKADSLLYNGKYSCAIWQAFARRGMGISASQGSSDIAGDEIPDFRLGGIIITKHADKKSVSPGRNINYTIGLKTALVCNGRIQQNYSITDSLPGNVTYVSSDGIYNPANRTVSFGDIDMKDGDSLTLKVKVKVKNNVVFPDSVYINDPISTPGISDKWVVENGQSLAWGILNIGIFTYYSNDATVKDDERLITAQEFLIPGNKTTLSFFNFFITNDFNNGGVVEITTDGGNTWEDLGPYIEPGLGYTETITGNSVLNGRKAFSGFGMGTTTIDLSAFAGKKAKIRFLYATSDNSFAVPNGGTGWLIGDILLSASPVVPNTARLFDRKDVLRALSTVTTKIKGKNAPPADFVVVKQDAAALLSWHAPAEINNGVYRVERSTDNGATFKAIGTLSPVDGNEDLQPYDFTDASPAEGVNLYRINHVSNNGVIEYSDVRSLIFGNLKSVQVFPNPAKDKIKVYIPGNDKTVTIQLIGASGNQIKTYRVAGQNIELNLPVLSHGMYYLNIIRDGSTSRHKIVVE